MAFINVHCPACKSDQVRKHGKTPDGKQRYYCENENCVRSTFILNYQQKARIAGVKEMIIDMTLNGSGIRDIGRVLKISTTTVIKEIKKSVPTASAQSKRAGKHVIQRNRSRFKVYKSC